MAINNEDQGKLYIVPTPIGNLEDITLRALHILKTVDAIACEDTRHSLKLLSHFEIRKTLISYHDYNEEFKSKEIVEKILKGSSIALISDAGTPGISDPGYKLINAAIENNIEIVSLPGATAMIPALVASGFPIHSFVFKGFPPAKKGRQTFLTEVLSYNDTVIVYESSHKIAKLVEELNVKSEGELKICVVKEISKVYETYYRGSIADMSEKFKKMTNIKGEFVVILSKT